MTRTIRGGLGVALTCEMDGTVGCAVDVASRCGEDAAEDATRVLATSTKDVVVDVGGGGVVFLEDASVGGGVLGVLLLLLLLVVPGGSGCCFFFK